MGKEKSSADKYDKKDKDRKETTRSRSRGRSDKKESRHEHRERDQRKENRRNEYRQEDHNKDKNKKSPRRDLPVQETPKNKHKDKKRPRSSSSSSSSRPRTSSKKDENKNKNDMSTVYDLEADVPSTFTQSGEFLDFKEIRGLALSKLVRDTPMSRKMGIAGKDIRTIRIVDLCYKKMENWYLRAISAGRFVNVEFTRSIKESIFISRILKNMRPKQNTGEERFDLDKIAAAWAATHTKKFDTDQDKREVYQELADHVFRVLNEMAPQSDTAAMETKIKELEARCAKLTTTPAVKAKKGSSGKIENFFNNKSKKKNPTEGGKDQDKEEEEDEDEESDTQNDVLSTITRVTPEAKVLRKNFPKGTKARQVDDWIKLQAFPTKIKSKVDKVAADIFTQFMAQDVADRVGIKECLADWGATIDSLQKADNKQLIRIAAAAKQLTV